MQIGTSHHLELSDAGTGATDRRQARPACLPAWQPAWRQPVCCLHCRCPGMPRHPGATPRQTLPLTWHGARRAAGATRGCACRRRRTLRLSFRPGSLLIAFQRPSDSWALQLAHPQGADACILFLGSRIKKGEEEPTGVPVSPDAGLAKATAGSLFSSVQMAYASYHPRCKRSRRSMCGPSGRAAAACLPTAGAAYDPPVAGPLPQRSDRYAPMIEGENLDRTSLLLNSNQRKLLQVRWVCGAAVTGAGVAVPACAGAPAASLLCADEAVSCLVHPPAMQHFLAPGAIPAATKIIVVLVRAGVCVCSGGAGPAPKPACLCLACLKLHPLRHDAWAPASLAPACWAADPWRAAGRFGAAAVAQGWRHAHSLGARRGGRGHPGHPLWRRVAVGCGPVRVTALDAHVPLRAASSVGGAGTHC